ncbi:11786_t:CDS:2 [Funneliformis geosporum]|uniref:Maintenance of mitochondrial morphology protein 1 n=1 Tax=Funneliformis geosporum TaxID=1117311 RepID=A0A9W4SD05_9GLOM|nr:11786_t:CDS:2 [Funneliformis geosporum]CAI2164842.1 12636_t:CDS:2 [Funneliformis geosporum]
MSSAQAISPEVQEYLDHVVSKLPESSWSFMQGFLIGQLSVVILVFAFIKYMLLEDVKKDSPQRPLPIPTPLTPKTDSSSPVSTILSKTLYDPAYHPPESTAWLNVLIGQAIYQYRDDAKTDNRLVRMVDEILNGGVRPDFVGPIEVTRLDIGEEFPVFNNARIRSADSIGKMRVEVDCDYCDQITLGIDTQILINWPKPKIAVLPISLVLSVIKFSSTITLEIVTTPESSYILVSILPDFILEFNVQSLIGSRSKLEDIPKITHIITSKLRNAFCEKFVYPNFKKIKIPDLWSGNKKSRNSDHLSSVNSPNAFGDEEIVDSTTTSSTLPEGLRHRNNVMGDYPIVQDTVFLTHGVQTTTQA